MFGGPVIVLSKCSFSYDLSLISYTQSYTGCTACFCVVGGNTKREQGRKVQESNVAAAKVSDNMLLHALCHVFTLTYSLNL